MKNEEGDDQISELKLWCHAGFVHFFYTFYGRPNHVTARLFPGEPLRRMWSRRVQPCCCHVRFIIPGCSPSITVEPSKREKCHRQVDGFLFWRLAWTCPVSVFWGVFGTFYTKLHTEQEQCETVNLRQSWKNPPRLYFSMFSLNHKSRTEIEFTKTALLHTDIFISEFILSWHMYPGPWERSETVQTHTVIKKDRSV